MNIQFTDEYKRKGNLLHFLFNIDKANKESNRAFGYIYLRWINNNIEELKIKMYPQYEIELNNREQEQIIQELQNSKTWVRAISKLK